MNENNLFKNSIEAIPLYMWVVLCVSVLITITGFFIPPVGAIDGTAITMCGVLFGGTSFFYTLTHLSEWIGLYKEIKKTNKK